MRSRYARRPSARRAIRLIVARITPPTSSGRASPAPVFGIVWPSTLELLSGTGDVVDGDADALGEAEADPVGKRPGPAEPEGDADGEAEPDGLGDVCAFDRVPAVAADAINMSRPVINDNAASTASIRGTVLRIRPPFCILLCLPRVLPPMHGIGGFFLPDIVRLEARATDVVANFAHRVCSETQRIKWCVCASRYEQWVRLSGSFLKTLGFREDVKTKDDRRKPIES